MTTRIEMFDGIYTTMTVAGPGTRVGADKIGPNDYGVVISGDTVAVVEGTADRLRTLLQGALDSLPVECTRTECTYLAIDAADLREHHRVAHRALVPTLDVPQSAWTLVGESVDAQRDYLDEGEPTRGDEASHLLATLSIAGTLMHADAFEVQTVDGLQEPVQGGEAVFDSIHTAVGADGPWETTTINGRDYVLVITPHC